MKRSMPRLNSRSRKQRLLKTKPKEIRPARYLRLRNQQSAKKPRRSLRSVTKSVWQRSRKLPKRPASLRPRNVTQSARKRSRKNAKSTRRNTSLRRRTRRRNLLSTVEMLRSAALPTPKKSTPIAKREFSPSLCLPHKF
jgi:hypothetical protein